MMESTLEKPFTDLYFIESPGESRMASGIRFVMNVLRPRWIFMKRFSRRALIASGMAVRLIFCGPLIASFSFSRSDALFNLAYNLFVKTLRLNR